MRKAVQSLNNFFPLLRPRIASAGCIVRQLLLVDAGKALQSRKRHEAAQITKNRTNIEHKIEHPVIAERSSNLVTVGLGTLYIKSYTFSSFTLEVGKTSGRRNDPSR